MSEKISENKINFFERIQDESFLNIISFEVYFRFDVNDIESRSYSKVFKKLLKNNFEKFKYFLKKINMFYTDEIIKNYQYDSFSYLFTSIRNTLIHGPNIENMEFLLHNIFYFLYYKEFHNQPPLFNKDGDNILTHRNFIDVIEDLDRPILPYYDEIVYDFLNEFGEISEFLEIDDAKSFYNEIKIKINKLSLIFEVEDFIENISTFIKELC